jgi:hypothetical protein
LPSSANITWARGTFTTGVSVLQWQTLQDPDTAASIASPFWRLAADLTFPAATLVMDAQAWLEQPAPRYAILGFGKKKDAKAEEGDTKKAKPEPAKAEEAKKPEPKKEEPKKKEPAKAEEPAASAEEPAAEAPASRGGGEGGSRRGPEGGRGSDRRAVGCAEGGLRRRPHPSHGAGRRAASDAHELHHHLHTVRPVLQHDWSEGLRCRS